MDDPVLEIQANSAAMDAPLSMTQANSAAMDAPLSMTQVNPAAMDAPVSVTQVKPAAMDAPMSMTQVNPAAMDAPLSMTRVNPATMDAPVSVTQVNPAAMDVPVSLSDPRATPATALTNGSDISIQRALHVHLHFFKVWFSRVSLLRTSQYCVRWWLGIVKQPTSTFYVEKKKNMDNFMCLLEFECA